MVDNLMTYVGHPISAVVFGIAFVVAGAGVLYRLLQQRKRDQYMALRKDILRIIDDEVAGIRSDISVVIENELGKMKKNIFVGVRSELLKLKEQIPVLIEAQMRQYEKEKPINLNDKVIPLNKTKNAQLSTADDTFENEKGEALDVEKEIAKLNRNMSVVTALLVEMNHRTGKKKQQALTYRSEKRPKAEGIDL
jgi:hypothetical protein